MKTGEFYYNLLPDDVKIKWRSEFGSERNMEEFLEGTFEDLTDFLSHSFVFVNTYNGGIYWRSIGRLGDEYLIANREQKLKELGI